MQMTSQWQECWIWVICELLVLREDWLDISYGLGDLKASPMT